MIRLLATSILVAILVAVVGTNVASQETGSAAQPSLSATATGSETVVSWSSTATYRDPASGLVFEAPSGLVQSEYTVPMPPSVDGAQQLVGRSLLYSAPDGRPVISAAVMPNPHQLDLADWIATVPGWPGDPTQIEVAGTIGLYFTTDQAGGANPTVYFKHDDDVIAVRGATDLAEIPPAVDLDQFQSVLDGLSVQTNSAPALAEEE